MTTFGKFRYPEGLPTLWSPEWDILGPEWNERMLYPIQYPDPYLYPNRPTRRHVTHRTSPRQVRSQGRQVSNLSETINQRASVDNRLMPYHLPLTPEWDEKKDIFGQSAMMGAGAGMFIKNPL